MAGTVTPRVIHCPNTSTDGSSPDSDLEFVASTKVRMKDLEREAEHLDKAFQDYHRRVTKYPATRSPPAARSPPAPHLLGALKSIPSGSSDRNMLAEDGALSEPPAVDVATALAGTAASRLHRGTCQRPSATPLAKAKRGLDGKMHLEGEQQKRVRPLGLHRPGPWEPSCLRKRTVRVQESMGRTGSGTFQHVTWHAQGFRACLAFPLLAGDWFSTLHCCHCSFTSCLSRSFFGSCIHHTQLFARIIEFIFQVRAP